MNFFMGGMNQQNIDYIKNNITVDVTRARIWGVSFPEYESRESTDTFKQIDPPKGTRLYTAEYYTFEPSTQSYAGVDNFIEDNAGPFMIRECCTRYNSSTGKQEVVSYEGDPTWDTDKVNTEYNRMIEFPLFYYQRPSRYTFLVSSDPVKDFLPSPMHYRNGILYDHVYVSKYILNLEGRSQTGQTLGNQYISKWYNVLSNQGLNLLDYKIHFSIAMLMYIKYAYLSNFYPVFGPLQNNGFTTGVTDGVLSNDGVIDSSKIKTFGMEEYLGYSSYSPVAIMGLGFDPYYDSTATSTATGRALIHDFGESMLCIPNYVKLKEEDVEEKFHKVVFSSLLSNANVTSNSITTKDLIYLKQYPYILFPEYSPDNVGNSEMSSTSNTLRNFYSYLYYGGDTSGWNDYICLLTRQNTFYYSPTSFYTLASNNNFMARSYFNSNSNSVDFRW